jgi:hypothetical protein
MIKRKNANDCPYYIPQAKKIWYNYRAGGCNSNVCGLVDLDGHARRQVVFAHNWRVVFAANAVACSAFAPGHWARRERGHSPMMRAVVLVCCAGAIGVFTLFFGRRWSPGAVAAEAARFRFVEAVRFLALRHFRFALAEGARCVFRESPVTAVIGTIVYCRHFSTYISVHKLYFNS